MKFKETKVGNIRHRLVRCKTCGEMFDAYIGKDNSGGIFYHCIAPFCEGAVKGERNLEPISKEEAYAWLEEKYHGEYERMLEVREAFGMLTEEDMAYLEEQREKKRELYQKRRERNGVHAMSM